MSESEKNKYDTFMWVKKVIDSCETITHFVNVRKLITNFFNTFKDIELNRKLRIHELSVYRKFSKKLKK
jgi:hypothetical protein